MMEGERVCFLSERLKEEQKVLGVMGESISSLKRAAKRFAEEAKHYVTAAPKLYAGKGIGRLLPTTKRESL